MNIPVFLDLEASSYEEDAFPLSIAWSLPDGRIKNVLVMPDETWNPRDNSSMPYDLQHYFDQGASVADIAREMNQDLDGLTIYIDGLDPDEEWLEKLFEAAADEPTFEIARIDDLFIGLDYGQLIETRDDTLRRYELDGQTPEGAVLGLLYMAQQLLDLDIENTDTEDEENDDIETNDSEEDPSDNNYW
ncbi:MAG: hypothetical protein H7A00_03155 [Hahellaceae bacterium]|nr:hypothetical protein [Hahellaceae bacterium]